MAILAGDIGGTHLRLARWDGRITHQQSRLSRGVDDVSACIAEFLAEAGRVHTGCLAVAGPVFGGRAHLTNLGWSLDERKLSQYLNFPVKLINDFHAQALAMPAVRPMEIHSLAPTAATTDPPGRCRAVIGPGTGLGEAILVPASETDDPGHRWQVVAGEGGHARYAPRGPRELELLAMLTARFGAHVSVERVLSGAGIAAIDECLRGHVLAEGDEDAAAAVTQRALKGSCAIAVEALDLFVAALADEAANLALRCNAGRVYLTGGIPPRILPFLAPRFRSYFEEKGRYSEWLRTVPVDVVLADNPGLLGAVIAAGGR